MTHRGPFQTLLCWDSVDANCSFNQSHVQISSLFANHPRRSRAERDPAAGGIWATASSRLKAGGYLGRLFIAEQLAGVVHGKQRQVEEGASGADVEVVGEELALDEAEGVAREAAAHHEPCKGGRTGRSWGKAPSPGQRATAMCTDHNLPATKVTQTCIPQEVERKTRCSSLMALEGSALVGVVSRPGMGPSMSVTLPPESAPSCRCCRRLAGPGKRGLASQGAWFGKSFRAGAAPAPSQPPTAHPTRLQTQFSAPLYLRGRALRQPLVTDRCGWTFGKVQPKPHLTPGSGNKQKVNRKGKSKSPGKSAAGIKEASWPAKSLPV